MTKKRIHEHSDDEHLAHGHTNHEHRDRDGRESPQTLVTYPWTFSAILVVLVVLATTLVLYCADPQSALTGEALSARLSWAVAAMLFLVLFAFALGACVVLMFNCGQRKDATIGFLVATIVGVLSLLIALYYSGTKYYLGSAGMRDLLANTAFSHDGVRRLASAFNGLACWASAVVVATSCVISKNDVSHAEDLSRQLRGSKILMYIAAGLLIAGVSETSTLHKWPAHEGAIQLKSDSDRRAAQSDVDVSATAISMVVGTVFSLVLAAAYLPLIVRLRQRAYEVVKPWERTEAWLGVHGFALQPTQQLSRVLLILSPLLAGGPVSYLITLLSSGG